MFLGARIRRLFVQQVFGRLVVLQVLSQSLLLIGFSINFQNMYLLTGSCGTRLTILVLSNQSVVKGRRKEESTHGGEELSIWFLIPSHIVYGAVVPTLLSFYPNGSWLYRMELVKKRITSSLQERDNLEVLEQVKIESTEHIFEYKRYVGGEGIMLVNPNAQYELCRSYNLLKVKTFYETEATVIGYEDGQNRHSGRMGSIIAKLTWDEKVTSLYGGKPEFVGKTVSFGIGGGFTDEQREWSYVSQNFPIGSEIHFSYLGVSSEGVPVSCNHIQD